jgi:predicted RNase H-like nuclease (RuvC/YqgF family)
MYTQSYDPYIDELIRKEAQLLQQFTQSIGKQNKSAANDVHEKKESIFVELNQEKRLNFQLLNENTALQEELKKLSESLDRLTEENGVLKSENISLTNQIAVLKQERLSQSTNLQVDSSLGERAGVQMLRNRILYLEKQLANK